MKRFKNILYVADPSLDNGESLNYAIALARQNQAKLTLVEIVQPLPSVVLRHSPPRVRELMIKERKSALEVLSKSPCNGVQIETKLLEGIEFLEVIREVIQEKRDLVMKIVVGRNGGFGRLFSSSDMHLLRKCPCPVWLIKSTQERPFKRIMAAVDFDDSNDGDVMEGLNRKILEMAISLAQMEKCGLDVVHVQNEGYESYLTSTLTSLPKHEINNYLRLVDAESRTQMNLLIKKAKQWVGDAVFESVGPRAHVTRGRVSYAIVEQAKKFHADLLVMGTVGRSGIPGLLIGNTAETVLEGIECSVLALKPEGFATPVTLKG